MSWQVFSKSIDLGDGKIITIETGKMARQADGAVLIRQGDTALLATVVSAKELRDGVSFFPLSVDYQEKFASAGRIPGGFLRREGRLSTHEILISRLVDRTLRPLFPDHYRFDTQVMLSLISQDANIMPDALTGLAASAALSISDIPFAGPISEVRVAFVNGEYIVNPYNSEMENAKLDIIIGATEANIMMVEGEATECSEEELVEAIKIGHEAIKVHCRVQNELREMCGKPKREIEEPLEDEEIKDLVKKFAAERILEIARGGLEKHERKEGFDAIKKELVESFGEEPDEEKLGLAKDYFKKLEKEVIREMMLGEKRRLDGRKFDEVRPLNIEIDLFAAPHGCSLFCRGETQALATVTLGTKRDEQMIDKASGLEFSKFLLHYNFPAFSTGETRPNRGPGRREIGHGNLAERSLRQVMPLDDDNPYTVRIVSDILESNGSSSMATVCAGSLALMDAGVPTSGGVSGIAMGLISDGERVAVLSDILGDEDHLGDMDFKVTGTQNGICAVQMDIKVDGLPYEVLINALKQAKEGRLHILNEMNGVIDAPRPEPKPHAPRIEQLTISKEYIGAVIGPGGKIIQELQEVTQTVINIEEVDGKGIVTIASENKENIEAAKAKIRAITAEPEVGEVYEAIVKTVMPYGAFVEFIPGKEGLLHISEISWKRLESMDDVFNVGDKVKVKLLGIDSRSGKFKLSRKVLLDNPYGDGDRGGDRRGGDRRGGDRRGGNRNRRDFDKRR